MNRIKITHEPAEGESYTIWSGEYQPADSSPKALAEQTETVKLLWLEDDAMPIILLDDDGNAMRELAGSEVDLIREAARITQIEVKHARASQNGHPICAAHIPEIWMGTCGNFGFKPDPRIELTAIDSGDDSPDEYTLTGKISKKVKSELDEITKRTKKASAQIFETDETHAGQELGAACLHLGRETNEELEAYNTNEARAVLAARQCLPNPTCPTQESTP